MSRKTGDTGYYNMVTRLHKTSQRYPANFIMEKELHDTIETFIEHYRMCISTAVAEESPLFPAKDDGPPGSSTGHQMSIRNLPLAMTSAFKKRAGLPLRITLLSPRYIRKVAVSEATFQNLSEECYILAHVMAHTRSVARLYYEQNQTDTLLKYLEVRMKIKQNATCPREGLQYSSMPPPDQQPDLERSLDIEAVLEDARDDDFHMTLLEATADVHAEEPLTKEQQIDSITEYINTATRAQPSTSSQSQAPLEGDNFANLDLVCVSLSLCSIISHTCVF